MQLECAKGEAGYCKIELAVTLALSTTSVNCRHSSIKFSVNNVNYLQATSRAAAQLRIECS